MDLASFLIPENSPQALKRIPHLHCQLWLAMDEVVGVASFSIATAAELIITNIEPEDGINHFQLDSA